MERKKAEEKRRRKLKNEPKLSIIIENGGRSDYGSPLERDVW